MSGARAVNNNEIGQPPSDLLESLMTHDAQPLPSSTVPGRPRDAGNRWIAFRRPSPRARVRLLCFHHAGGNALVYRPWVAELPDWIDVCPVQLPGRGLRI